MATTVFLVSIGNREEPSELVRVGIIGEIFGAQFSFDTDRYHDVSIRIQLRHGLGNRIELGQTIAAPGCHRFEKHGAPEKVAHRESFICTSIGQFPSLPIRQFWFGVFPFGRCRLIVGNTRWGSGSPVGVDCATA